MAKMLVINEAGRRLGTIDVPNDVSPILGDKYNFMVLVDQEPTFEYQRATDEGVVVRGEAQRAELLTFEFVRVTGGDWALLVSPSVEARVDEIDAFTRSKWSPGLGWVNVPKGQINR